MLHLSLMKNTSSFVYTIFSIAIFLGSFLLFQIQPIIGKYILPWFGGTSFVWITSLLFFQLLLLAGYFYSYLITKLPFRKQVIIHLIVTALGILATIITFSIWPSPLTPDLSWRLPDTFPPGVQVLHALTISVGLPYFILSITSTLLQRWFSNLYHKKTPYTLYSISNIGSLLGIATYPFLIEPTLTIHQQSFIWSGTFIIFLLILCFASVLTFNKSKDRKNKGFQNLLPQKFDKKQSLAWLVLPGISSIILLSSTNQLTQTVAPIPFLWLLPLGLYLLSFIICFDEKHLYKGRIYAYIFLLGIPVSFCLLIGAILIGIIPELVLYTVLLFSAFMLCHGELYNLRPKPESLNLFYLYVAFGSAIGGFIVAIIAPILFKGTSWEFLLGLFLASLVAIFALKHDENSLLSRFDFLSQKEISVFLTFVFCTFFILMGILNFIIQMRSSVGIWRNFYGTLRVTRQTIDKQTIFCLINGKIIHGCQYNSLDLRHKPITYFGEKGGLGMAIASIHEKKKHLNIGIIGLGAGTIAAYGQHGDSIRFYELNPKDVEIAQNYFTYLKDSKADIAITVGDGRLSMEKELKEQGGRNYDLVVIDAFSDDGIPFHLLTKDAFAVYQKHLARDGIIAIHISSTYLNLKPPMIQLAKYYKLNLVIIDGKADEFNTRSNWALFSANKKLLATPSIQKAKINLTKQPTIKLWTDNYSNLFQLLQH